MLPILALDDADNCRRDNAELVSECLMGMDALGVQLPDFEDIRLCQFGPEMGLPTRSIDGSMFAPVKHIAGPGIVSQVVQEIIGRVSIVMTTLQSWWAGAPESEKDKDVDANFKNLAFSAQGHSGVACTFYRGKNMWFLCQQLLGAVCKSLSYIQNLFFGEFDISVPRFRGPLESTLNGCGGDAKFTSHFLQAGRPASGDETSHPPLVTRFISREVRDRQPSFLNIIGDCVKFLVSHAVSLLVRGSSGLEPGLLYPQWPGSFFYTPFVDIMPEKSGQNG
mgnify:CR=1 FL=1